jgi:hypothetical protein
MLLGYAMARLKEMKYQQDSDDERAIPYATLAVASRLSEVEFNSLVERGAALSETEAASLIEAHLNTESESPLADAGRRS